MINLNAEKMRAKQNKIVPVTIKVGALSVISKAPRESTPISLGSLKAAGAVFSSAAAPIRTVGPGQ